MNFASSLCRRLNIKELVTNVPVYRSTADVSGEGLSLVFRRWATKKTAGSTKNGRDSKPKNLGVKKFGGERVIPGNIIVRQRGTRFHPGNYVGLGKDHTLFALKEGWVKFERNKLTGRKWVHVEPKEGHVLHPVFADVSASEPKDLYGRKVRVNYATEKSGPGFSGGGGYDVSGSYDGSHLETSYAAGDEFSTNSNLGYDGELDSHQDDCISPKKVLFNLRSLLTNLEDTPCKKQETCGF